MKKELVTAIGTALIGVVLSYLACSIFTGEIEDKPIKVLDSTVDANLQEPNVEIFNYKSLNPVVEVYVGECEETDENGECLDDIETSGNSEDSPNNSGENRENP